ncbi:5'-3' DNA helicase ZGRF1-like isoform X2 [Montipora foliosa]|uniref:5'-3' DNA helicase ZGRF1-like isoform X2 n=1 Tax=Montipora foliosa TaxID=591990 RepID=UPI0035F1645F
MYSVLYTHQKAKKAKTWQDGTLRVTGMKAILCDEESKTLDSLFIQKDQVAPGEEMESDRYLITIEEKLDQPSSDHTQAGPVSAEQKKKLLKGSTSIVHQPFKKRQPTRLIKHRRPALSQGLEPQAKKPKQESSILQPSAANRGLHKNDFFDMYTALTGEDKCIKKSNLSQSKEPFGLIGHRQQHQKVLFSSPVPSSAEGKENHLPPRLAIKDSFYATRSENLKHKDFAESKRTTGEILALFSSSKNSPHLPKSTYGGTNIASHAPEYERSNIQHSNLEKVIDKKLVVKDACEFRSFTDNISGQSCEWYPDLVESDLVDLNLNLMPDSPDFFKSNTRHSLFDHSANQQWNYECDFVSGVEEHQAVVSKESDSKTLEASLVTRPLSNFCSTQKSPSMVSDLVQQRISLSSNLAHARGSLKDLVANNQRMPIDHSRLCTPKKVWSAFSANERQETNDLERSPDANVSDNHFHNFARLSTSCIESKCVKDVNEILQDSGLSTVSHSVGTDESLTRVIPSDSQTVKTGQGHSWKGSVVSDTVKRAPGNLSSLQMVPMQWKLHNQSSLASSSAQKAPLFGLNEWQDSNQVSPCSLMVEGFPTSYSIALSSTEGNINSSQVPEQMCPQTQTGFVQRVPQLCRRAPLLSNPSEGQDDPENEARSTAFHEATAKSGNGRPTVDKNGGDKHKDYSLEIDSCQRIDFRGVGLTRNLSKNHHVWSHVGQESHVHKPLKALSSMAEAISGERSMAGELSFSSAGECDGAITPTRHVTVPVTFENVMQYRQVFKAALREHLNIVLFELAQAYHGCLQKVDVSGFGTHEQGDNQRSDGPSCSHGQARLRAVRKEGPNKGRLFYSCPETGQAQCKFFKWVDEYQASDANGPRETAHKMMLSSPENLMAFLRSNNVAFYCDCRLTRKYTDSGKGRIFGSKRKKWTGQRCGFESHTDHKKGLYLELPRKEHSSVYSKDDVWIISKSLSFNKDSTFIASSAYYGPSSSGELEILPISGYSPSNWQSGESVYALMACNAGTELSCINNIEEHVKMPNLPVLPYILHRPETVENNKRSLPRAKSSFVSPLLGNPPGERFYLPSEITGALAEEMIARFNLNKDQAAALQSCARMFSSCEKTNDSNYQPPVSLIHGVFGAGKSYLLSVIVLYLVELFNVKDSLNQQSASSHSKILVSSTTNVAVDRILLSLLDMGFEDFVRVGSIRKIAKPVLPYSVHSTGSDNQELKELQALLKGQLTPAERTHVRKSIERHKQGENKKKLSLVRVVGVTCAASVFPHLDKLKFPVLLLDECSQMTEPVSLLPMARFECQRLVLVGDPKQLSPTIQGSEPEHEAGLEQTLFDRLIKMGYEATLLRTQYRCHPAISAVSNRLFYDNKLLDGVTAEDRSPVLDLIPTLCFYNVAKGKEECGSDGSYYNEAEARFVVFVIECLLKSGVEPAQIGVITLYKSQLHTIANNLTASRASSHAELKAIQISTVDAFQGGEKDIIILSCVRTDHIGFIDCDRRTNVALTRAKRHLVIIGNLKMLSCNTLWGKVIDHCREAPGGLCHSQDFVKKWTQDSKAPPKEGAQKAGNSGDVEDRQGVSSFSSGISLSASSPRKMTEQQVIDCPVDHALPQDCDGMDTTDSFPCDSELPTFDLVSSLGILL